MTTSGEYWAFYVWKKEVERIQYKSHKKAAKRHKKAARKNR